MHDFTFSYRFWPVSVKRLGSPLLATPNYCIPVGLSLPMLDFGQEHDINVYHGITVYLVGLLTVISYTCVKGILYTYVYNLHVHMYHTYCIYGRTTYHTKVCYW